MGTKISLESPPKREEAANGPVIVVHHRQVAARALQAALGPQRAAETRATPFAIVHVSAGIVISRSPSTARQAASR